MCGCLQNAKKAVPVCPCACMLVPPLRTRTPRRLPAQSMVCIPLTSLVTHYTRILVSSQAGLEKKIRSIVFESESE